ncbi:MAG: hypothetical protein DME22_03145 [Verrucomicrobia bacterium]|nr:MAG: hypothetical protein DME22_03145 [Verrucomicrobiota bacterium]PYK01999.1 MAG: hypothetical protein DME23_02800 [Verrucomicrobiota bacterium]
MKSTSVVFVALAAFGFFALAADKQSGSDKNASPIVGTWELVSEKWGDAKEFTDPPAERKSIKFITPTHWIWVWVDPKTKKITNSMGGTYKYAGDSYIEIPEFAFEGMGSYVGKEQKFTVKIEGDKWIHSGVLSAGQKLEEIWKRVK